MNKDFIKSFERFFAAEKHAFPSRLPQNPGVYQNRQKIILFFSPSIAMMATHHNDLPNPI